MRARLLPLGTRQRLAVERDYPALLPGLMALGLPPQDAVALAYNAAFLWRAVRFYPAAAGPEELLDRLSPGQIAALCEAWAAAAPRLEALQIQ